MDDCRGCLFLCSRIVCSVLSLCTPKIFNTHKPYKEITIYNFPKGKESQRSWEKKEEETMTV